MKYLLMLLCLVIGAGMCYESGKSKAEGVVTTNEDDDPTSPYYCPYVPYPKSMDLRDTEAVIEYNYNDKISHMRKSSKHVDGPPYVRYKLQELELRIEKLEKQNE